MNYELLIAIRHMKSRTRHNIISIITFISIFGIALGVACLIIVLAVMTGFTDELKEKMLSMKRMKKQGMMMKMKKIKKRNPSNVRTLLNRLQIYAYISGTHQ